MQTRSDGSSGEVEEENSVSNGEGMPSRAVSRSSRMALAAKISAARTLARKLAEEKQAAAAAVQLASQRAVDPETAAELIRSAEAEVAELAKEAAEADAIARKAVKAELGSQSELELLRLKEENSALEELVRQLAADREQAERKLQEVKTKAAVVPAREETKARKDTKASLKSQAKKGRGASVAKSKASMEELLVQVARNANAAGSRIAMVPEGPASLESSIKVLYNLNAAPLPRENVSPVLKMGLNRWETQVKIPMTRMTALDGEGAWFGADVDLPRLLFRVDFVVRYFRVLAFEYILPSKYTITGRCYLLGFVHVILCTDGKSE